MVVVCDVRIVRILEAKFGSLVPYRSKLANKNSQFYVENTKPNNGNDNSLWQYKRKSLIGLC